MDEIAQVDDQIAGFADIQVTQATTCWCASHHRQSRFLIRPPPRDRYSPARDLGPQKGPADVPYVSLRKKLTNAGVKTIGLASSGAVAYMSRGQRRSSWARERWSPTAA